MENNLYNNFIDPRDNRVYKIVRIGNQMIIPANMYSDSGVKCTIQKGIDL
mgnify:CR=1 FL=1